MLKIVLIYIAAFTGIIWFLGFILRLDDLRHGKKVFHPFFATEVNPLSSDFPWWLRLWALVRLEFLFLLSVPVALLIALSRPVMLVSMLLRELALRLRRIFTRGGS